MTRPGNNTSIIINIEEDIQKLRDDSNCCIYHVPENLVKVSEDAYRPLLVSIGPVFSQDKSLSPMNQLKLRYFKHFLARKVDYLVEHYRQVVMLEENVARECYLETIELPETNDFINLLLLDAVFIVELFLKYSVDETINENDRIFKKPRMIVEITRDLRLAENQIPFSILKKLYMKLFPSSTLSFLDIAYKFFMGKTSVVPQIIKDADIKHLVDLLRECHKPSELRKPSSADVRFEFPSSLTKLREHGVKIEASTSENSLDVKFNKGKLEIPRLKVTDDTESLYRNMMVFEQCHHHSDSYIIDYIAFLNCLISTPEDVDILVRKGILENWLGNNEEVANLFSKLFKEIRMRNDKFYYSSISRDLNAYAKKPWHYWLTILLTVYLKHPWKITGLIYATLLLTLAVLQVYTGFKSLKQ